MKLNADFLRAPDGFATTRGLASYEIASSRADQVCPIKLTSQLRAELLERPDADARAAAISALQTQRTLQFPKLDLSALELRVYADSSWARNLDLSSYLGYVIFLADEHNSCAVTPGHEIHNGG